MDNNMNDQDIQNEYTVNELLDQLLTDDSWEKDEAYRKKAIQMLKRKLPGCIPKSK